MTKTKEILIIGFALFSLFFGAGNLILPPFLGANAGEQWWLVFLGFIMTAVFIPILGVLAHAKVQGTMYDLAKKVAPWFGSLYCVFMYLIAVTIPAPRTASVAHEMAIQPFFGTSPLLTSSLYFLLIFIFAINRSKVISLIGKFLTPIIVLILLAVIVSASSKLGHEMNPNTYKTPFINGILEGYQTFDAIGGVLIGAVIIISLKVKGHTSYKETKALITKAGFFAGAGLLLIYGGLLFSGAILNASFAENASRTDILTSLSSQTLGTIGTSFLSVLVALACFTTAVGIVTGTSDYVKGVCKGSQKAYVLSAFLSSVLGVLIGHFEVDFIIKAAIPTLMFIYPITIVLILLNVVSNKFASPLVFKGVVFVTLIFSIPDFLGALHLGDFLKPITYWIPLSSKSLGWVLPAFLMFISLNVYNQQQKR
jgi:LIVCS family branched-chain amino acid:cation transporter|tara:strand:- start:4816 stop:6090 length:1275 start_codon:yes stop_codon:yes gene_type:complete